MTIKTYHSDTVESAVRRARLELGDEAMLLESRQARAEDRHRGAYEVLFAVPGAPAPPAAPTPPQTFYRSGKQIHSHPELGRIYQDLVAQDLEPELAAQLVAGLTAAAERGAAPEELRADLREELEALLAVDSEPGIPGARPAVVALVGPAGAGKTSTLAKLAFRYGLQGRRPVELLSIDHCRIGAFDQLRHYGSLLGLSCRVLDHVEQLRTALDGAGPRHLLLLDTPGCGFSELDPEAAELGRFLTSRPEIDTHLVLSASTKPRDLRRLIECCGPLGPRKLLFTKLDETLSLGPLLNEAVRTQWPLSFFGLGRRIPEDLAPAAKTQLAGWLTAGGCPPAGN